MQNLPQSVRTVKDPTLPAGDDDFAGWVRDQAGRVRLQGGHRAEWLAGRIDRLADLARYFGAADGCTLDDREQVAEESRYAVSRN